MESTQNEKTTIEKRRLFDVRSVWFKVTLAVTVAALITAIVCCAVGISRIMRRNDFEKIGSFTFTRVDIDDEDYSEDDTHCTVKYESDEGYILNVVYSYEEWETLPEDSTLGGVTYREVGSERTLSFLSDEDYAKNFGSALHDMNADDAAPLFNIAIITGLLAAAFGIITFFGCAFTLYEKCWFLSVMVLASVFAVIFPEESANGVNGIIIMALYLLDTFLNVLCELLISKQSKWNFIVSVFVEITEILILVVLSYRFATMATTLFFWLPCDIISFINWSRKPDKEDAELTKVRTLKGWQEVVILIGIAVWTIGVGYLLTLIDIGTDIFGGNDVLANVVCYLDACASAVGIVNGLAILFRFREQWIAWYVEAILETVINILSGQYILLVLKAGYLTNTTYGYIKWTKYIKEHPEVMEEKSFF